jgi:phosphoglucosamine mutase
VKFVHSSLPAGFRLDDLHVVLDCANGAAWETSPLALRDLGARVDVKCAEPDGININTGCGSTYPEQLAELVKETGARVGISHDGDADRLLMCDENGDVLDGDELLAIAALSLLDRGELAENTLVATVMSNFGLEKALEPHGGKVVRTKVGDRPVLEEMLRGGYSLGGEQSGHIIFRDYHTTGDGLLSALQILRIIRESGEPLSRLRQVLKKYPQEQRNVRVSRKPALETLDQTQRIVEKAQVELGNAGRVLLRYSGTEPKLRILVEGSDAQQIANLAESIADAVESEIGAER